MNATRKLLAVVGVIALLFAGSWIGGHVERWRAGHAGPPKPPPTVPGHVDQGTPVVPVSPTVTPAPPPPTVVHDVRVVTQELTREQVIAKAREYGMTLPAPTAIEPAPVYPLFLTDEHFGPGPCGDGIKVSAWLDAAGATDLVGKWDDYTPPPPRPPEVKWLQNIGRWQGRIGVGLVGACLKDVRGESACDGGLGGEGGVALRGWRTGHATWSLDADAGAWKGGVTGHTLLTITFP